MRCVSSNLHILSKFIYKGKDYIVNAIKYRRSMIYQVGSTLVTFNEMEFQENKNKD